MTPERIAELTKDAWAMNPAPTTEALLECLAEIQRLQAALPTPAKEPSGELEKALEKVRNKLNDLIQHQKAGASAYELGVDAFHICAFVIEQTEAYRAQVTKEGM